MRINLKNWLVISMLLVAVASVVSAGQIVYVDANASGAYDGSSWEDAFPDLQIALVVAAVFPEIEEIRVAQGIYKPAGPFCNRATTFQLLNGVAVKGGYGGYGEPDPNARDIETYKTILSGDLNGNDEPDFANNDENSYHVVTGSDTNETAVLDGFIITTGNANGSEPNNYGGGMYNGPDSSPTVINCKFTGNSAAWGGAMFNCDYSSPTVTNCKFSDNLVDGRGGAMLNDAYSSANVTYCTFASNSAASGGGMCNDDYSNPIVTNCRFIDNLATSTGGGIHNEEEGNSTVINCTFSGNLANRGGGMHNDEDTSPMVANCTFNGNSASKGGGMSNDEYSSPTLTNCTFIGNSAGSGGGMYNNGDEGACNPILINCTFSGNSATGGGAMYNVGGEGVCNSTLSNCIFWANSPDQISLNQGATTSITYSDVQGDWLGEGNIDIDPCFADANNGDYHLKSEAGRWDPNTSKWVTDTNTSPCIDAGDPNSDWIAELWPHGKRINMGAFGGTPEASMSSSEAGNIADLSSNDIVDYTDLMMFTHKWLYEEVLLSEDLDRNGIVNFNDFAIFANNWLWEE